MPTWSKARPRSSCSATSGQHFFGIQGGDGVAGNVVQKREVAGFGLLLAEQARIFDGDTGLAGQYTHQFQMTFVVEVLLQSPQRHHTDDLVIGNQGHAAE